MNNRFNVSSERAKKSNGKGVGGGRVQKAVLSLRPTFNVSNVRREEGFLP